MAHPIERIFNCIGPIDKQAARVIQKARPADVWMPKPKNADHMARSENVLRIGPIPKNCNGMENVVGKRRGTLTVVGYADPQPNRASGAAWVVRCDCGNYEHRSRILRWIGTQAHDMCSECRVRHYKSKGDWSPREKAHRSTLIAKQLNNQGRQGGTE